MPIQKVDFHGFPSRPSLIIPERKNIWKNSGKVAGLAMKTGEVSRKKTSADPSGCEIFHIQLFQGDIQYLMDITIVVLLFITYLSAKRREFSGMIHWLTINFIIPFHPQGQPIQPPYVKRTHAPVFPGHQQKSPESHGGGIPKDTMCLRMIHSLSPCVDPPFKSVEIEK